MTVRTRAATIGLILPLLLPAAVGAGCSPTSEHVRHGGASPAGASPPMTAPSASTEAEFLTTMVAHHREAIESAGELARSPRPRMRELGRAIVRSQSAQVRSMERWLAAWYPGVGPAAYRPMMRDLSSLGGDALDRAFLEDMPAHHMAAVMAARHALALGVLRHRPAEALAHAVVVEQRREIALMTRWRRVWFGQGMMPGMW